MAQFAKAGPKHIPIDKVLKFLTPEVVDGKEVGEVV